eukprot:gene718-10432_t
MAYVFFPNSKPSLVDDIWFQVDKKVDEDAQLSKDEDEYYKKVTTIPVSLAVWA